MKRDERIAVARLVVVLMVVLLFSSVVALAEDVSPDASPKGQGSSQGVSTQPAVSSAEDPKAPPEKKDSTAKQPPEKDRKQDSSRTRTRTGYGSQSSMRWNGGNVGRLERDVSGNMRNIDNAIRRMNIDINRIRNLERRF
ncbi:MAG: hypothetical protein QG577_2545 [Thermodesulfobacteriota bacterium]|nr:hypothetical protein [Thermodesulfobacteriota bacterium]